MKKPSALEALKEIIKHFDNNPESSRYSHRDLKYAVAIGREVIKATCKTCTHWDRYSRRDPSDDRYGVCALINEADVIEEGSVIAYVSDCGGGTPHRFHTQADFNCPLRLSKEGD